MVQRLQRWVLGAVLLGWLTPCAVLAHEAEYAETWDDFSQGFSVDEPGSKWFYFRAGSFVGDDGIIAITPGGLNVWSSGWNSATGEPAFANTVAPEPSSGLPGGLDHVKWLAYMNHTSTAGYPGFDAQANHELACRTTVTGQTYGTHLHPFGAAVSNAQEDPRLASFAMNTIDFQSYMVFDFMFTNGRIYAIYERLPFGRDTQGNYAAFTYAIPVGAYSPWQRHTTRIAYDKTAGVVKWVLNGAEVFRVSRIGHRLERQWMIIDHGGTEQLVSMNQLNCGMGMFSLLDASWASSPGLVRLSSQPNFYYQPQVGTSQSLGFTDEYSTQGSRLFGQGAEFEVGPYRVISRRLY
ncbi:MAG TPA: DUF6081 family protein [Myxococcaceae bacterium]|nr:DUF6081 family protein [Myxococcaceae bacterium]